MTPGKSQCSVHHLPSEHVREDFNGKTVWEGDVEVSGITGYPGARHCYGWSDGEQEPGPPSRVRSEIG